MLTTVEPLVVSRVTGKIGAEISGVDLSQPLSGSALATIKDALWAHGVIFFRDQDLTPQQYLDFVANFGELSNSRPMPKLDGYPMVNVLTRAADEVPSVVGGVWHTDQAYRDIPTWGTVLYGVQVPEYGGDTAYINMEQVYDSLSDGLKSTLEGLRAVHVHAQTQRGRPAEEIAKRPEVAVHPVVTTHPETGRKALFVSPGYTERFEGWTVEESAPLLAYLFEQAYRPEFGCRFSWRTGSLAFWDNRSVWHYAINDSTPSTRVMHRLIVGEPGTTRPE